VSAAIPANTPASVANGSPARFTPHLDPGWFRIYQREADKQRLLARKADFAQARLLFIVEAIKDILADEGFVTLLKAEGLATMPRALATRIEGRSRP
jgi:ParB family chromosome partitioning protein